jgi:hypothetical protein
LPVVLDIDGSVGELADAVVLPLGAWQESIRFGCGMRAYGQFTRTLNRALPNSHGTAFLGSGDFHHISAALIARHGDRMFDVVVLDNHPDNMRFPFGIHCGSWVRWVSAFPFVRHVHVLGITSNDVAAAHAWGNYFMPLLRGKLTNWCIGIDVSWAARLGLANRFLSFDSMALLLDRFAEVHGKTLFPTYLTIDKDVLSPSVARTNWDQGCMSEMEMLQAIALFRRRLVGSDVTGDVSTYHYRSTWKRCLSALDRQSDVSGPLLADWQRQQHAINCRLLEALNACN